jgi:hypothetical protein
MKRALLTLVEYCSILAAILLAIQIHNGHVVQQPIHAVALGFAIITFLFAAHWCRAIWSEHATSTGPGERDRGSRSFWTPLRRAGNAASLSEALLPCKPTRGYAGPRSRRHGSERNHGRLPRCAR